MFLKVVTLVAACVALVQATGLGLGLGVGSRPDYLFAGDATNDPQYETENKLMAIRLAQIQYCNLTQLIPAVGVLGAGTPSTNQPANLVARDVRIPCGTQGNLITVQGQQQLARDVSGSSGLLAPQISAATANPSPLNTLQDYLKIYDYFGAVDGLVGQFTDEHFGQMRLTYYGVYLKRARAADITFMSPYLSATERLLWSTNRASIYMSDYEYELGSAGMLDRAALPQSQPSYARRAYYRHRLGKLEPLGVLMYRNETVSDWITPTHPNPMAWLGAKMWANNAEVNLIPLYHFADQHLTISPLGIAAFRRMSPNHVVYKLLDPIAIDYGLARSGFTGIFNIGTRYDRVSGYMAASCHQYMNKKLNEKPWVSRYIEADLEERDVTGLPGYLYGSDLLQLSQIFRDMVKGLVYAYYDSDTDVQNDVQLQNTWTEAGSPTGGRLVGLPPLIDRRSLVDAMTHVQLSRLKHAVLNLKAYPRFQMLYPMAPYRMNCAWRDPSLVTESFLVSCLPTWAALIDTFPVANSYDRTFPDDETMLYMPLTRQFGTKPVVQASNLVTYNRLLQFNNTVTNRVNGQPTFGSTGKPLLPFYVTAPGLMPRETKV